MKTEKSRHLFKRAVEIIPGGVNSPVRACRSVGTEPLFIDHAEGCMVFDVDGNGYIDYIGSWGPDDSRAQATAGCAGHWRSAGQGHQLWRTDAS